MCARSQWRRHHPDRHPVERAGPPDRLRATGRRAVRAAAGARPRPAGRYRQDRHRSRHRRLGFDPDRRRQRRARHPRSRRQAEGDRRRGAGDQRRRSRDQRRHRAHRRHRPLDQLCRSGETAGRRSLEAECERDLHAGRRHLPERHASRRGRDRSRHRHHQDRQLCHRRRFRRDAQSAAARRPGAWRRDAGDRPGADGAGGLQLQPTASSSPAPSWTMRCRAPPTARHSISRPTTCRARPIRSASRARARRARSAPVPAVVNAIIEGLWREYKIDHIDMPATAERVWIAIREAQKPA